MSRVLDGLNPPPKFLGLARSVDITCGCGDPAINYDARAPMRWTRKCVAEPGRAAHADALIGTHVSLLFQVHGRHVHSRARDTPRAMAPAPGQRIGPSTPCWRSLSAAGSHDRGWSSDRLGRSLKHLVEVLAIIRGVFEYGEAHVPMLRRRRLFPTACSGISSGGS